MLLKDCIVIKNGKDYSHLSNGDVPVFGTGGILTHVDKHLYDAEALLLPRKGSLNNVMYIDKKKFWTVDTMFYAVPKSDDINLKYLYYYLTLIDIKKLDVGSTIPSMTSGLYYQINVDIPAKEKQDKVVKILSSIDEQIERNNAMIQKIPFLNTTKYSVEIMGGNRYEQRK